MTTPRSIVIHGHFYQPPREDPWLDEVVTEPSAAPFHDWNDRIEQECYRAVGAARLPGPAGRIAKIVNLYEWLSFDFGPTLLEWLEHAAPDTYADVLAADRASVARLGQGNAMAMPYHHAILPLSSRREKVLEVRWGIADFRRRFGREPQGMWLPETAVDEETLDVLAQEGIAFTVLAPSQVKSVPPQGLPGRVRTPSGRTIAVFLYDGAMAHDVAFGPLVRDGMAWAGRLLAVPASGAPPALISVATDGETFGHHHPFGEMALARVLETMRETPGVQVDNFASFLARHGVAHDLELVAPSSWSCAHGVERWRSDCGCRIAPDQPTNQRWRAPLREAVTWLISACHEIYDTDAARLLRDPEAALAGFGAAIGAGAEAVRQYGGTVAKGRVTEEQLVRATELLQMERGALSTLTSCAWFFDDISGIESLQILRYAAWAIALAGPDAAFLEEGFTRRLALAESNFRALGSGRDIYLHRARPRLPPQVAIGAGLAAARAFAPEAASSPAWLLQGPDEALVLTNRRTGHRYELQADLEQMGLDVRVTMRSSLADGPVALALADLPDRQRIAIAAVLRGEALDRLLNAEERVQLARGEELRPLIRHALARRVHTLTRDAADPGRRDIADLLDILEQLGQAVPFEVQTVFYRLWDGHQGEDSGLSELAQRLGFVAGPTDEDRGRRTGGWYEGR
jgi:Domain of unknown function (DUF3536)/Glycosyl hydrolase family 57